MNSKLSDSNSDSKGSCSSIRNRVSLCADAAECHADINPVTGYEDTAVYVAWVKNRGTERVRLWNALTGSALNA